MSSPEYKKALELMGKKVLVKERYWRHRNKKKRWWESKPLLYPRVGWVTGIRWLQTGEVYTHMYYSDGGNYLYETKPRQICLLVSFWPTENPVKVPIEAVELTEEDGYSTSGFGEGANRKQQLSYLSQTMKDVAAELPRDEKGRFVSPTGN